MLIIASAAYAVSELCAEFGRLPPAFLPIGNRRLYALQLEWAARFYDQVVMTLPGDYELQEHDRTALESARVRIVRTDSTLSLADSLRECLRQTHASGSVDILYGDTLFNEVVPHADMIVVGRTHEYYDWHVDRHHPQVGLGEVVWAGFFSFSDGERIHGLLGSCANFIEAVERYSAEHIELERYEAKDWYDFGHVHTYFLSKQAITTARHFNALAIEGGVLTKTSHDSRKMNAEATWFETAPSQIRVFQPKYVGRKVDADGTTCGYSLEYMPLLSLSELLVFGRLPKRAWEIILKSCSEFLDAASTIPTPGHWNVQAAQDLYLHKTIDRVETYARESDISLDCEWRINGTPVPSIRRIIDHAWQRLADASAGVESYVHGDFCFSNILYDFRSHRVKVIDPRGLDWNGNIGSFSDFRYDIGKLAHSAIGLYDVFIAGRFFLNGSGTSLELNIPDRDTISLRDVLDNVPFRGKHMVAWGAYPIMVLLFLSMLPLHKDRPARQRGLLANALRLYTEMPE